MGAAGDTGDERLTGSDVELASALARALGLEPVYVRSAWRTLVADLAADRYDLAVGGISVTPERAALGAFSPPLAHGGKTAIGRCSDARRLRTLAAIDRPGVRAIVNPGGTNERFARETLRQASLALHADNRTIFDELIAGRADVMLTDDTEVALQAARHAGVLCRLTRASWRRTDKAWLMPRDPELQAAVAGWLGPVIASGEAARTLARYTGNGR